MNAFTSNIVADRDGAIAMLDRLRGRRGTPGVT
jgi:hypothetical protein